MIKNEKMKLEEAVKILKDDNKVYELNKILNDTLNIDSPKYYQALTTVLQELNNLQEKNQTLIKYIGKQGLVSDYMRYKNSKNK